MQSFGNIIMTMPLTFLFAFEVKKFTQMKTAITLAFLTSLAIEATQGILDLTIHLGRIVDVDDLIFNTTGGVLGLLCYYLCIKIASLTKRKGDKW
jgi:glycopeptide antibiotics resistance protein